MSQRINRVQLRRPTCGSVTKQNADYSGKRKRDHIDLCVEVERHLDDLREAVAEAQGNEDAHDAADAGQSDSFDEELQQHLARGGADGEADADLVRALGHGDEHDVHDADPTDQQRHTGHRREQHGHELCRGAQRLGDLSRIEDVEVVVLVALQVSPLAHDLRDLGDQLQAVRALHGGDGDLIDVMRRCFADQTTLQRGKRHDDGVILIAHASLAFRREQPDDLARSTPDANAGPDGVFGAKQLHPHGVADHAHRTARAQICLREESPFREAPLVDLEIDRRGAGDRAGAGIAEVNRAQRGRAHRRDGGDARDLLAERFRISFRETRHARR